MMVGLFTQPQTVLKKEFFVDKFHGENLLRVFILPMSILCSLVVFVGYALNSREFVLEQGIVKAIFNFVSLYIGALISVVVVRWIVKQFFRLHLLTQTVEMVVCSLMALSFVINLFLGLMPSMFFLRFANVYMIYIAWAVSSEIVGLDEKYRNKFMLSIPLVVIVLPLVVTKFLRLMVPNLAY